MRFYYYYRCLLLTGQSNTAGRSSVQHNVRPSWLQTVLKGRFLPGQVGDTLGCTQFRGHCPHRPQSTLQSRHESQLQVRTRISSTTITCRFDMDIKSISRLKSLFDHSVYMRCRKKKIPFLLRTLPFERTRLYWAH